MPAMPSCRGFRNWHFISFPAIGARERHVKPAHYAALPTKFISASQARGVSGTVLDNQHRVIRHQEMFASTISSVVVHPREIVRAALKANAAAIILAHKHPSGKAEPSHADRVITKQVINACLLLEIRVLDHLVICQGECVSFAEREWL